MVNSIGAFNKYMRAISNIVPIFLLLIFLVSSGCAPPPAERPDWTKVDMVWPMPPEEPKIRFLDILQSNRDVGEDVALAKQLFGEDLRAHLQKPFAAAADKEGRVYVVDPGRVFVFDKKNKKLSFIGDSGAGKLAYPLGIDIAADGRIYVADAEAKRVFVYDDKGRVVNIIGARDEFLNPVSVAIDNKRSRLYVTDSKKHFIRAYTLDGTFIKTIGEREIFFPTGVDIDSEGNIYVVDTAQFRIAIFDPEGNFKGSFGKIGDRPGTFTRPKGIAIDSEDHIYVVDAAFQNFQIFNKEGQLLLFVGGAGREPGRFSLPAGIYIDENDKIYVGDQLNRRVQIFQYLGEKWKQSQGIQPDKK